MDDGIVSDAVATMLDEAGDDLERATAALTFMRTVDITAAQTPNVRMALSLFVTMADLVVDADAEAAAEMTLITVKATSPTWKQNQGNFCHAITLAPSPCRSAVNTKGVAMCRLHHAAQSYSAFVHGSIQATTRACACCLKDLGKPTAGQHAVCVTCPATFHRDCVLRQASAFDDAEARVGLPVQCARCAVLRPQWVEVDVPRFTVTVHTDLLNVAQHGELRNANRRAVVAQGGQADDDHSAVAVSLATPPRSIGSITDEERERLTLAKATKAAPEAIRDHLRQTVEAGLHATAAAPATPISISSLFDAMPGDEPALPAAAPELPAPSLPRGLEAAIKPAATDDIMRQLHEMQAALVKSFDAKLATLRDGQRNLGDEKGASAFTNPPRVTNEGRKTGFNRHNVHISSEAHPDHPHYLKGHDYLGVHPLDSHEERRMHLIGAPRLDLVQHGALHGTVPASTKTPMSTPTLHSLESYLHATLEELTQLETCGTGVWDTAHTDNEFHAAKLQLVAARSVFILATIDYLLYYKQRVLTFDKAWEYVAMYVRTEFSDKTPNLAGLDGALMQLVRKLGRHDITLRADAQMRLIVKQHFDRDMFADLADSVPQKSTETHKATTIAAPRPIAAPAAPFKNTVAVASPAIAAPRRCVLCRKEGCSYEAPTWACTNPITHPCSVCAKAGFPNKLHARTGPRNEGKTCEEKR